MLLQALPLRVREVAWIGRIHAPQCIKLCFSLHSKTRSKEGHVVAGSDARISNGTACRPTRWMSYVRCGRAFASLGDASFRRRTSKASIPLLIPVSSKHARVTRSHQPRSG